MRALARPTRLVHAHNPTSQLIQAICKKQRRDKRKKENRMS